MRNVFIPARFPQRSALVVGKLHNFCHLTTAAMKTEWGSRKDLPLAEASFWKIQSHWELNKDDTFPLS